jgi:kumamolisin
MMEWRVADNASYKPGTDSDAEVTMYLEIVGSIVPRAHIRIYFAPFTASGFADALKQAAADHVSVVESCKPVP